MCSRTGTVPDGLGVFSVWTKHAGHRPGSSRQRQNRKARGTNLGSWRTTDASTLESSSATMSCTSWCSLAAHSRRRASRSAIRRSRCGPLRAGTLPSHHDRGVGIPSVSTLIGACAWLAAIRQRTGSRFSRSTDPLARKTDRSYRGSCCRRSSSRTAHTEGSFTTGQVCKGISCADQMGFAYEEFRRQNARFSRAVFSCAVCAYSSKHRSALRRDGPRQPLRFSTIPSGSQIQCLGLGAWAEQTAPAPGAQTAYTTQIGSLETASGCGRRLLHPLTGEQPANDFLCDC